MAILSLKEIQTKPVLQEKPVQEVVVAKLKPIPPPQVVEVMVKPFSIRTIDHDVTLGQIDYHVHLRDIKWLKDGVYTSAKTTISRLQVWEVESSGRLLLTYKGQPRDCTEIMIGTFAKAGIAVNRRFIDACLFPIQCQIIEVERRLKSFA